MSPVLEQIRSTVGLGYVGVSLLTVIPTLSMGVFAFLTPMLTNRLGSERVTTISLGVIAVATFARAWSAHVIVLFATTIGVSVGIAVAQAVLPRLVGMYFPENAGVVTGLYMATLVGGAGLASALTAPLAEAFGTWTTALATWGGLAVLGGGVWLAIRRRGITERDQHPGAAAGMEISALPWRRPWAWLLAGLLVGVVAIYFVELTWLAPLYVHLGWSASAAGYLLTVSVAGQVVGALVVSGVSLRTADRRPALAFALATSAVGLVGVTLRPLLAPWVWAILMGVGIGGAAALAFTLPVDYAASPAAASRLSAFVIGVGYLAGGITPLLAGWFRTLTGSYDLALLVLVGINLVLLALAMAFRPARTVEMSVVDDACNSD
ncbi:MFS transporter [Halobacterium zhouii]|uniref:MFS transporter n=1 Tax=Halobacterium zhouii TaxID=2902624 RepID=UPI001E442E47|nr:MFS transporter [Halobacterium zhouii]